MRSSKLAISLVVIVLASIGALYFVYYEANSTQPIHSTASQTTILVTIIEDSSGPYKGMNGSAYHSSTNLPVIHAQKGDLVTIHIENVGTTEPHGFAIDHYFVAGVAISEGGSYNITFVASEIGSFRMYCSIFCSIHPFMQNGLLIVS